MFDRKCGPTSSLIGYVDSNCAGDLDNIKSLTNYVFTLSGYTINWKSILQSTVALSTIEAEYITEVIKEAIWLRGLVSDFGLH